MRLTVNLDSETSEELEELANSQGHSKSQVVRDALTHYHDLKHEWQQVDEDRLKWFVRLLGGREHRIYDMDHIDSLLAEVDSIDRLKTEWYELGKDHGVEWSGQFPSLERKLQVLEYCNWYTITSVDDDQYHLVFSNDRKAALVGEFLRGECEELGFPIDVNQIDRKLIVTEQSD